MNVLFWNLKGNYIIEYLINCLTEYQIDIAIFSEFSGIDFSEIEKNTNYVHIEGMGGCEKITMLVLNTISVDVKREQSRYTIYQINFNGNIYNLAGVHLQDRYSTDKEIRILTIGRIVNDISNLERSSKCNNTIIIGDFNANPFDDELLRVSSFNAVLFKSVIEKSETRTIAGVKYRRFYNPILHFISEDTKNYGSFYYIGDSNSPVWHCLDQVIVSKSLVNDVVGLRYLKSIQDTSLIKKVQPDKSISDHLPLFVKLV